MSSASWGCSPMSEGVDDDLLGVILNYLLGLTLLLLSLYISSTPSPNPTLVRCELGMSLGYLLGGVVHGTFPNRASDDNCAAYWFYPLFSMSYTCMIYSCYVYLSLSPPSPMRWKLQAALCVSAFLVLTGGMICQLTVDLYPGKLDDCPPSSQAACDKVMMSGEGVFYVAWTLVWWSVGKSYKGSRTTWNSVSRYALVFGPMQILAVCIVPVAMSVAGGGTVEEGMGRSLEVYCGVRTGVTYILAVLASHFGTIKCKEGGRGEAKWLGGEGEEGKGGGGSFVSFVIEVGEF